MKKKNRLFQEFIWVTKRNKHGIRQSFSLTYKVVKEVNDVLRVFDEMPSIKLELQSLKEYKMKKISQATSKTGFVFFFFFVLLV